MNSHRKLWYRSISFSLLVLLILGFAACRTRVVRQVEPNRVDTAATIVGITTTDGQEVMFDRSPKPTLQRTGSGMEGLRLDGEVKGHPYSTTLDRTQRVWVERREISTVRTVGLVAGVAAATVVAIVAIDAATNSKPAPAPSTTGTGPNTSCPFIYSWDGTQFVFDAEPYGGATTRGLERDDVSELEHLLSTNGEYRILMSNEQEETQFSNLMELQVVDHPIGTRVVADAEGHFHTIGIPQTALRAWDREGHDLAPWFKTNDKLIWEPTAAATPAGNIRDEINLTFRKPQGIRAAKLVTNAGTGLWGSFMIKKMMLLRGRELPLMYTELDTNPFSVDFLRSWTIREELFALKVYLAEKSNWAVAGILAGGGPYSVEDRVVPIDLTDSADGDIQLQLRPPAGFWAINSVALDFTEDANIRVHTLSPFEATDESGRSVRSSIRSVDDKYYEMPNIGNHATLRFRAPEPAQGMSRTVFLHSRGYYKLHLDAQGDPQAGILQDMEDVPNAAARFAAVEYAKWLRAMN